MKKYKLSIFCPTYNHEKYIEQCLESMVKQKTNFPFNIFVLDDCSTDKTRDIVIKYQQQYPELIHAVLPEQNIAQNKGFYYLNMTVYRQLDCEFFLVNEGDDYFCDEYKLQKQVDFLDAHPNYAGCFHTVQILYENTPKKNSVYPPAKKICDKKYITFNDLLYYNYMQTNSVMYRWAFTKENIATEFPPGIMPGDLYLHLLHAQHGNFAYLPEIMSVYRKHDTGIWNTHNNGDKIHQRFGREEINFLEHVYKKLTNCSQEYLQKGYLPLFTDIVQSHLRNNNQTELEFIKTNYSSNYAIAITKINSLKRKKVVKNILAVFFLLLILLFFYYFL